MKARAENGKFTNKFKRKRLKNLLNSNINDYGFLEGRRVVEFQVMIEGLKKCYECENELSLTNIKSETKYGLGSLLHIECAWCSADNAVPTGKRHKTSNHQTGTRCFDINTKLAAAMINAGIGEQQMNNILAFMNLPTVNKGTLKTREREIGQSIETVAVQSCSRAVKEEILSSEEKDEKWVEVSADGGWQRRGTGHSNNSMSGHVTIVGKTSRKCLSFAVAKKNCRFCRIAKRRKVTVTKHKCRKNWSGSSKAMEPFLTLKCLQDLKGNGLDVNALTMDDDTSTFTRAKRCLFPSLRKNSDKNHVVKNMTNSLYKVKANNKKLSNETITYVKKCFSYAVSQNQGDPEGIKRNLNAIVPHSYGEHGGCDRKWCRADEANYRHSSLPGGRNLTDPAIRKDLEEVITPYISEKFTEKLASISTTNPNENLNMIISRKAPKGSHFSESDSLDIRVSAAIAQKNEGHAYILEVNDSHCLTPGHFTKKRCEILDKKRHYYATQKQTVKQKRRRIELKEERVRFETFAEVHEGKTYATAIDTADDITADDIAEIPPPLLVPENVNLKSVQQSGSLVVFDLETTGLAHDSDIIQLSARHLYSEDTFSVYMRPIKGHIPNTITSLTGISMNGHQMFYYMTPVESTDVISGLSSFVLWLEKINNPVLVAHNVLFDSRILLSSLLRNDIKHSHICGFADSLKLSKDIYPGRQSYKLGSIVRDVLKIDFDAHNAEADVEALTKLLLTVENLPEKLKIIPLHESLYNLERLKNEKTYLSTYDIFVSRKVVTKTTAKILAGSGLDSKYIEVVYRRSGLDGLETLIKNRMAKPAKTISNFIKYFAEINT